jgi:arylsulfatase A-like enzyme
LTWSWTVDGAPTAYAGDRVPATDLSPGETWEVTVAPSDGATLGTPARASVVVPTPPATNVLVILLDDVSTNKLALYDPAVPAVSLPTIDALAAQGVTFDQAYASPMCSPTRAALLTGRHARRTGFATVANDAGDQLSYKEVTVAEALDDNVLGLDWSTAALGKWHLAQKSVERLHPNKSGFDHFSGVFTVMSETVAPLNDYYDWEETTDGVIVGRSTVYHTTDIVDDALAHIPTMPEPWFLYLPMTAPHDPLHVPPSALVTDPVDAYSADAELYDAMLQAADAEIGRLLAGIDPAVLANTTVLLTADNGSQPEVVEAPYDPDRSKRSVYQGGIHVPLVITGPLVTQPGARTDALVHLVDVFTTALDIAGVPLVDVDEAHRVLGYTSPSGAVHPVDGSSLLPYLADPASPSLRPWLFAEHMEPNGPPPYANDLVAWQDHEWKLVRNNGVAELYQFVAGAVDEGPDLLADGVTADEQVKLDELTQLLDDQLAAMPYDGDW